jgi:WD40 repeat protein
MTSIFGSRSLSQSQSSQNTNTTSPLANSNTTLASSTDDEFESGETPPLTQIQSLESRAYNRTASSDDEFSNRPQLAHHLQNDSSILALAVGDRYIYAGTQDGEIIAWSLASFELVTRLQAHTRSVLSLFLSADRKLLFSSAGDAIVNAWCPTTLQRKYHIYSTYDVGDVFSVAYSSQFETVYLGAQNTSIQWCSLKDSTARPTPNPERHPDRRNHRFFDSVQHGGTSTPRPQPMSRSGAEQGDILEIDKAHMRQYAHFGYVYCMLMVRNVCRLVDADEDMLISGGGDGTIKLWQLSNDAEVGITEIAKLGEDDAESVLSLAVDGSFLYSSKLEGVIELWDLDTKQKLRVIRAHKGDVMTLQMGWGYLWSGGSTGHARVSFLNMDGMQKLTSCRNTARYNMANSKACPTSARNTTASIDGERMMDEFLHPQLLPTTASNSTSQEQTTIQSLFGISLAAILEPTRMMMFRKTSWSNLCKNSWLSKPFHLGQITLRIVDVGLLSFEHFSRSMER